MTTSRPLMLLLVAGLTAALVCYSSAASFYPAVAALPGNRAPREGYIQDRYDIQDEEELVNKEQLMNKVLGALMQIVPEDRQEREEMSEQSKRADKKTNYACHFKLCPMGKRRRR